MDHDELSVDDPDGQTSVVFRWLPKATPRAVLHILHGWGEHALRYDRVARSIAGVGYAVYADDHRGHGQTGVRSNSLGDLGPRGADGVLDAVHAVSRRVASDVPDAPLFVLGHSWGSMILQRYLRRWSAEVAGALLTGTTYRDPSAPAPAGRPSLNARFEPARTPYDWLTRDEAEVDRYIADPLCGFEIMQGRPSTTPDRPATTAPEAELRADLPIFIFNGADDPIGGDAGGRALADHYRSLGLTDVAFRAYPGARHELFNEINRDEVVADVVAWLEAHT